MLKSGIDTSNIFPDLRILEAKTVTETDENKIKIYSIIATLYADAEEWDKCLSSLKKANEKSVIGVKLKYFNESLIMNLTNSVIKCPKNIAKDIINELYEIIDKGSSINGFRSVMFINKSPDNEENIKLVDDKLLVRCANRTLELLKSEKGAAIFPMVPDIYYSLIEEFIKNKDYNKTFESIDLGVEKLSSVPRWSGKFVTFMALNGTIASFEVERGKAFIAMGDTNKGVRYLRELVALNQKNILPSFRYASRILSQIYSSRKEFDSANYYLKIADSEQNKSDEKGGGEYEIKLCVASWCSICRLHTLSSEHLLREKLKGRAKITVVADDKMIDDLKKQDPTISFENSTPGLLSELGVQGMPTMLVLRGKNVVTRFSSIDDSTSIRIAKSIMETLK
jgi:tetratricopeptide (TPR) repeat protein